MTSVGVPDRARVEDDRAAAGDPDRRQGVRGQGVVWLSRLLGRSIVGPQHQHLGHVRDVVASRSPGAGAVVTGLVADVGGHTVFVPAAAVRGWAAPGALEVVRHDRDHHRTPEETLLAADALGQAVLIPATPTIARITDVALRGSAAGWAVWAVDTRSPVRRLIGARRRLVEWRALVRRRLVGRPIPATKRC